MKETFDVAVVGLGVMGGAILYQLASRDLRVIGFDRYSPPHNRGSSHGETRIFRQAIGERLEYTPFVLRSNEIWKELEQRTGRQLLERCGFIFITRDDAGTTHHGRSGFLEATRRAALEFAIEHELLTADEIRRRFPQFGGLAGDETAYYEPGGGFLFAEVCVSTQLELAKSMGTEIRTDTTVSGIQRNNRGLCLQTNAGEVVAGHIIVAAGPWAADFAGGTLDATLTVTRQALHWYAVEDSRSWADHSPTFIWTHGLKSAEQFYGFPPIRGEVKVAAENLSRRTTTILGKSAVSRREQETMSAQHVVGRLRGLSPLPTRSEACLYTLTADCNFLLADHPNDPSITIVSACSGHGFKHAAAIAEAIAQQLTLENDGVALRPFQAELK